MNILVFPYRDAYYFGRFGPSVRDLHRLRALAADDRVENILVVNRPVALFERLWGKRKSSTEMFNGVNVLDTTSKDIVGPLQGRAWTYGAYQTAIPEVIHQIESWTGGSNVLLDFTPMARIDYNAFDGFRVWYDHIDNFAKHNRYTPREKRLVTEKYETVWRTADLVTGVSRESLGEAPPEKSLVVPNGVWSRLAIRGSPVEGAHALGFTGFVTDKFDVNLLAELLESGGHTAAIHGRVLDRRVGRLLSTLPGVEMYGVYSFYDLPRVMSTFRVGLLPYLQSRSHDESPIKLYEYLNFGRPVISSHAYDGVVSDFVHVHTRRDSEAGLRFIEDMLAAGRGDNGEAHMQRVQDALPSGAEWPHKMSSLLDRLDSLFT